MKFAGTHYCRFCLYPSFKREIRVGVRCVTPWLAQRRSERPSNQQNTQSTPSFSTESAFWRTIVLPALGCLRTVAGQAVGLS